ncbi:hypothetical protein [Streptomyces longisporoflavus]|uniref:Uncharacterized protein n=1 Tax=Streptomyces longisporoflavus TaxID=28044 RepID=A0ABW7QPI9_9ACTN
MGEENAPQPEETEAHAAVPDIDDFAVTEVEDASAALIQYRPDMG